MEERVPTDRRIESTAVSTPRFVLGVLTDANEDDAQPRHRSPVFQLVVEPPLGRALGGLRPCLRLDLRDALLVL